MLSALSTWYRNMDKGFRGSKLDRFQVLLMVKAQFTANDMQMASD